jgi:hypothetical protein
MRRLADRIIKRIFDDYIIKTLRPRFPEVSSYDLDLLFADTKPDLAIMLTKRFEEVDAAARVQS